MRATTSPRPPAAAPTASPCSHCGHERTVAALHDFVGLQRRHPIPGMGPVLASLRQLYPLDQLIALCPGCFCITAELEAHDH